MQFRKARFGVFEIDLRTGELRKHGTRIRLQDQPFQVLQLLLERPGEIVTREELQSKLWPDNTFTDFDVGLNTAIKRLREALGDSAGDSRYVETLPRKGYRFIPPVEAVEEAPTQSKPASAEAKKTSPLPQGWWIWAAVGSVALVVLIVLGFNIGKLRRRFNATPVTIQSIAVLPLENLTGQPAQEYFVDGMTDALTTDLGKIGKLRVVSKTSMMRYKDTKKSLQDIASEVDVDALVEGSVTRSGDRIRITANLVQVAPEKHLWADSFEANIQNVLDLQDDASRAIANAIQVKLSPQEQARLTNSHPVNPQAYDAYLQGRFFMNKSLPLNRVKPTEYFQSAIRDDPAWALPYAGLAESYMGEGINLAIPNERCTSAKNEVLEALKRDSESPEAHTILADVEYFCDWNWAAAEKEVQRAIEVNPNLAQAHSSRSRYLLAMGKTKESLEETKHAVELDPLSFRIRWDRWLSLYLLGRYDEALEQCRKVQELNPTLDLGYLYCGDVYIQQDNFKEAVQQYEKAVDLTAKKNPRTIAHLAYGYALAGRPDDARRLLADLIELSNQRHVHPDLIALVYVGLGQKEKAIEWLDKAYQVRARDLLEIRYDPKFAGLRTDPRFVGLIGRIGLPPL